MKRLLQVVAVGVMMAWRFAPLGTSPAYAVDSDDVDELRQKLDDAQDDVDSAQDDLDDAKSRLDDLEDDD